MVNSQHKRLLSKLRNKGKLSVYTKGGIDVPLNISCPKSKKRKIKVEGSESLCSWLRKRHPTINRHNRSKRNKKVNKKVNKK